MFIAKSSKYPAFGRLDDKYLSPVTKMKERWHKITKMLFLNQEISNINMAFIEKNYCFSMYNYVIFPVQ